MKSTSPTPSDPLVGKRIDERYRIVARLARGGMASVYVATDERLDRPVALKLMHAHLAESPQFIARFQREARAAARISHRGVVPVYDQGSFGDQGYLVMELVDGPNLRAFLQVEAPLSVSDSLAYAQQILAALSAAHSQGVIHRDLKPENVLVATDGSLRVVDFGLARAMSDASLSSTGSVLGTISYLAPEVAASGTADERTDIFSVGIMLSEMLTGVLPWADSLPLQSAYARIHEDVPPPSEHAPGLPAAVDELVETLCARDPEDRPLSAEAATQLIDLTRASLSPAELEFRAPKPSSPDAEETGTERLLFPQTTSKLPVNELVIHTSGKSVDTAPSRRKEKAPLLVLVALLVIAGLASGTWWWIKFGPGAYVDVPAVAGQPQSAAEAALEQAGLRAITRLDYSDDVAAGMVIETNPQQGQRTHKDTVVTMLVSEGVRMVEVPKVTGIPSEEAEALLKEAGLGVGQTKESWSETAPVGQVLSATPAPGTSVRHDSKVVLEVSRGKEPIDIPAVVGMSAESAAEEISAAELVPEASEAHFDDVPAGVVASQAPAADGGTLFRGDTVTYVISLGPELFEVPNVKGMNVDEATQILRDAGFTVEVNRIASFFNFVGEQSPAGGEMVRSGTTVTLSVV